MSEFYCLLFLKIFAYCKDAESAKKKKEEGGFITTSLTNENCNTLAFSEGKKTRCQQLTF